MLLQDFNYFFNKAIYQYINKRYNIYDINQQTTDDLRVLKATTVLPVKEVTNKYGNNFGENELKPKLFGATYEVELPRDYLHMLNCVCVYKVNSDFKCYDAGDVVQFAAKRLTADSWSSIINDFYNRPLPERPYYYIHNVNTTTTLPTNEIYSGNPNGTDQIDGKIEWVKTINNQAGTTAGSTESKFDRDVKLTSKNIPKDGDRLAQFTANNLTKSLVEKPAGLRYSNPSTVRCEIRYGKDSSVFTLTHVLIDYIKSPQFIRLTQEQVDLTKDTSQIMEFPDYVCQEIINELVTLVLENTANPRIQTHPIVTQSIANPAQQQTATTPQRG